MIQIPNETLEKATAIIGTPGIADDAIESQVLELVSDAMMARRLIDWIPEAFGFVLVSYIPAKIIMPTTFSARAATGKWVSLKLDVEPIYVAAVAVAQRVHQEGHRELFENIALRSSISNTVNNALNSGSSLDRAVLSGPALIGIPAEVYPAPKSFWRRWFCR